MRTRVCVQAHACVCVFVCVYHPTNRNKCWVTTVLNKGQEIGHYLGLGKHELIYSSIHPSNIFESLSGDKDCSKQEWSSHVQNRHKPCPCGNYSLARMTNINQISVFVFKHLMQIYLTMPFTQILLFKLIRNLSSLAFSSSPSVVFQLYEEECWHWTWLPGFPGK